MFIILNYTHSVTVYRFGLFHKLPGILLPSNFLLKQISGIDRKQRCLNKCLLHKKCLSAAFGSKMCILYSTDPRVQLSENSIVRTSSSSFTLWVISFDIDVPCFVGNIKGYRSSDFQVCGFAQKMTDSKCSGWSDWDHTYDYPCEHTTSAKILRSRNRTRYCTRPMFGGHKCTGLQVDEEIKYPIAYGFETNYWPAQSYCQNQADQALFTALFWFTENRLDEVSLPDRIWTGFSKYTLSELSDDTKYSGPSHQYITAGCGNKLWRG